MRDMAYEAERAGGEPLSSIFFGGGTPSLMPPALVSALLSEAERLWGFAEKIEITLEANPTSVETAKLADLAVAGINRVSLGIQSLDDEALLFLGREHNAKQGLRALDVAQTHFSRVSFDLIYARPGQTLDVWRDELVRALSFETQHLSLYQLTIEPGTRFATEQRRGRLVPLDDDASADMFALTDELTRAADLPAYEISNHAAPGEESRHNLTYWRYQDYVGIGPGAHGRRGGCATVRHKKPENWLTSVREYEHGIAEKRTLPRREQATEALLMGLRLREGVDLEALSRRFQLAESAMIDQANFERYRALGFVERDGTRIVATRRAMPILNSLLKELIANELIAA